MVDNVAIEVFGQRFFHKFSGNMVLLIILITLVCDWLIILLWKKIRQDVTGECVISALRHNI